MTTTITPTFDPVLWDALLSCDVNAQQTFLTYTQNHIQQTQNLTQLEQLKAEFLGKQSPVAAISKALASAPPQEKKHYGAYLQVIKQTLEPQLKGQQILLEKAALNAKLNAQAVDVSLPSIKASYGSLHPVMQTWQEIEEIFHSLGFCTASGPELEEDWYNFTALNSPMNHPARSMQDTFYVNQTDAQNQHQLLRTHTSPVQIRFAQSHVKKYEDQPVMPDIRMIAPGRTYRFDSDATHSPMFHQVEGLWLGQNISFADLKALYTAFLQTFFSGQNVRVRFRPSYFPFTEPSAEIDIAFEHQPERWLEISGAGQVHPKVLSNMGIDSENYTGFAFGSGLERLTMIRYGIEDLRSFFDGDVRFLSQFR